MQIGEHYERYLDLLSMRQRLTAANIANADTPGYKTQDIDFQTEFTRLLSGPQADGLPVAKTVAQEVNGLSDKPDGNNVSMDREARMLSENALRFTTISTLAKTEFRMIKNAIQEGRS